MSDPTLIPGRFADVTPSDTAVLNPTIGLYIGGAGVIKVKGHDDVTASFTVIAGTFLRGCFKKVLATDTTATLIVAMHR